MHWDAISTKRRILAFSVIVMATAMTILLYSAVRSGRQDHLTVWIATEHDVEVRIDILKHPTGQLSLSGTFTPTREQFYLYSKDLPKNGLNGLGRPTLLEVVKSDSIKLIGPLEANRPVQDIHVDALDVSFPVYPVGPVTLSLPFEFVGDGSPTSLEVSITYMACSDKTCLPPVIDKHILIRVPASFSDD
jgi:hypothetical protein